MTDTASPPLPDTKTINLKEAIELDGTTYTSITLREPTAGQIEEARKAAHSDTVAIRLIALTSGVPEAVVRRMRASNYNEAASFVLGFFT